MYVFSILTSVLIRPTEQWLAMPLDVTDNFWFSCNKYNNVIPKVPWQSFCMFYTLCTRRNVSNVPPRDVDLDLDPEMCL